MPEDRPEIEIDFEEEMRSLSSQVHKKQAGDGHLARIDRGELTEIIGQMIRPLAVELEALKRGPLHEHNVMLGAIYKSVHSQQGAPGPLETLAKDVARLGSIEKEIQRLGSVETANSKLFDALHAELKTYKDNFLFDSLQRPYIRDLVSLFDDLSELHAQTQKRTADLAAKSDGKDTDESAFLNTLSGNLENQIAHMVEVFLRMDVVISRTAAGAPHDKKNHRLVTIEPAKAAADDGLVVRSIKPGFSWHERVIRPEDVVVSRWTPPPADKPAPAAKP